MLNKKIATIHISEEVAKKIRLKNMLDRLDIDEGMRMTLNQCAGLTHADFYGEKIYLASMHDRERDLLCHACEALKFANWCCHGYAADSPTSNDNFDTTTSENIPF